MTVRLRLTPLQQHANAIPLAKFLDVWDIASPKERQQLVQELGRKATSFEQRPPARQDIDALLPRLQKAIQEARALPRTVPPPPAYQVPYTGVVPQF
jgi:hypothetical protein